MQSQENEEQIEALRTEQHKLKLQMDKETGKLAIDKEKVEARITIATHDKDRL
jgi:hypothetical protein